MCNIQGTELNYPYLLYNERVNFSKISAAESLLFTGKMALLVKNLFFFSKMAGDRGISLLGFFEVRYFGSLKWLVYG